MPSKVVITSSFEKFCNLPLTGDSYFLVELYELVYRFFILVSFQILILRSFSISLSLSFHATDIRRTYIRSVNTRGANIRNIHTYVYNM